jgi:cytosine/adenosine deaminase-related metal-dependent hydrolase
MIHKHTADWILMPEGTFEKNRVLIADQTGTIIGIEHAENHDPATLQRHSGIICPGFINAHCHLELSHMKGKVDTGSGLIPFISNVVQFRETADEEIADAIVKADAEMFVNGIVAVGDISNKTDTAYIKRISAIDYYSFVEMFDFLQPAMTQKTIDQYTAVFEGQSDHGKNKKSFVPHAPYSVSPNLFAYINRSNTEGATISIHNQETLPENELFLFGSGEFTSFYEGFGMNLDHFKPIGQSSIFYTLQHLSPNFSALFVHNTLTTSAEINAAMKWNSNVYWATCPNANLYIENRLPDYAAFLQTNAKVAIGTDSLTSNWQLSVWEEVKTIRRYQSFIPLETLLTWATLNGAEALGYNDRLGSFNQGKRPGILLLEGLLHPSQPLADINVRRLM